jgi:hypothetical protein
MLSTTEKEEAILDRSLLIKAGYSGGLSLFQSRSSYISFIAPS